MKYKKKLGAIIECTDGPLKGKKFLPGRVYDEIPEQDKIHFDEISETPNTETPHSVRIWQGDIKDGDE